MREVKIKSEERKNESKKWIRKKMDKADINNLM
jgi:hypothetical protein